MKDLLYLLRIAKRFLMHKRYEFVCKHCSVELASKIRYEMLMHRKLNIDNPVTLNEKLQFLKLNLYRNNDLVTQCCDKFRVREYVEKYGGGGYLTELYGVYDNAEQIDFDTLPDSFVLKCTHGSGSVIGCQDKSTLDITDTRQKLNSWLKYDYAKTHAELSYVGIKPRIICERYIKTKDGLPPKDYKIFCSYGVPKFLYIASERMNGHVYFDFYDLDWNWIDVRNGHPNHKGLFPKPENFVEMLALASKLSKPFPLVRVDLYNEYGEIIFGELTFLHASGVASFDPDKYDRIFGDYFPDVRNCKINQLI